MAVTRTGSVIEVDSSANSGSQSITVPSDAEIMVVSAGGYASGTPNFMGGFPPTIGGAGMTLGRDDDNNGSLLLQCIFYKVSPATGSQTFAWDWSGTSAPNLGIQMNIAFYKGIDTASPIGATAGAQDGDNSATTGSMTVANGDAVFIAVTAYNNASLPTITFTNCTELTDNAFNGIQCGAAEDFPTGNQTYTGTHSGGSGTSPATTISAIVIKQAAGGGSTAVPVFYHHLQQQGIG